MSLLPHLRMVCSTYDIGTRRQGTAGRLRLERPSSIARGFVRPAAIGDCQESAAGGVRSARPSPPKRPPAIAIARVTVVAGSGIRTEECVLPIDPACDRLSAALNAVAV